MNSTNSYKLALVGRSGVGKSSFAMRVVTDVFTNDVEATIGASFLTKNIRSATDTGSCIQLQIWDTAGQERYNSLIPMYTRGAAIILLCINSNDLNDLKKDIKTFKLENHSSQVIVVVTKIDEADALQYSSVIQYVNDMLYPVHFISSKTGEGIEALLDTIAEECLKTKPIEKPRITQAVSKSTLNESTCCYK